jgi:hypothetical protein
MSRQKQIEEMAMCICENTSLSVLELAEEIAEELTAKGYRKASEIFEEIEKLTASAYNDFMFNRDGVGMNAHYVVQFSDELDIAIAELKKKYTESEKDNG